MSAGEILIPCPNCKSIVRYDSDVQVENSYDACLICGVPFPEALRCAIETFVTDTQTSIGSVLEMAD